MMRIMLCSGSRNPLIKTTQFYDQYFYYVCRLYMDEKMTYAVIFIWGRNTDE